MLKNIFGNKKTKQSDDDLDLDLDEEIDYNEDDEISEDNDDLNENDSSDGLDFEDDDDLIDNNKSSDLEQKKKQKKMLMFGGIAISIVAIAFIAQPYIMNMNKSDSSFKYDETVSEIAKIDESFNQNKNNNIKKVNFLNQKKSNTKTIETNTIKDSKKINVNQKQNNQETVTKNKKIFIDDNKEISNISKQIASNSKIVLSQIENSNVNPTPNQKVDPFLLEFDSTVNSKKMRNALKENMSLMKDYIQFLEMKEKFDNTKKIYDKKKQKNIFEEEISSIKNEFYSQMKVMTKNIGELKQMNNSLKNKLNKKVEEVKKTNVEVNNNKTGPSFIQASKNVNQNVYKIGNDYLLEEISEIGSSKVYKKGNTYANGKIEEISPEFIKIKDINGNIQIMNINKSESITGVYSSIKIDTPFKDNTKGTNTKDLQKNSLKVESYATELQNRNLKETNQVNIQKRRFLR